MIKKGILFFLLLSITLFETQAFAHFSEVNSKRSHLSNGNLSDTLDALKYEIEITDLDFVAKTITAKTTVTLKSKIDILNVVKLELLDLIVDEVFVNGNPVSNFQQQNPFLSIPLSSPINSGEIIEVKVHYHGSPFHENWGGFHWSGQYAFNLGVGFTSDPHNLGKSWFPCIDDFHDRAIYELFVTVTNPKVAVCGGTLLDVIENGNNTKTYHWKIEDEIPTYLASVAVGEYINKPSSFVSVTGEEIPIGIYVRPSDTAKVQGSFQTLVPMLEAFEQYLGPYRWERVGYVSTAIGAMEHSTNIAIPHATITGGLSYESLFAHELSHQWFGDLVTCASAEDMWLNEGWAVFCESLYREALYGWQAYHDNMFALQRTVLHSAHVSDNGYRALYGIPTQYTYGTTVYNKGGIVVHTLRNYMGDDLFFPAVRAYLDEYAFNHADTWQLRDILSNHSGVELTDFFETWVFTPGFPEFSIDSFNVISSGNNWDVTVFVKQKLKGPCQFANSNRIEVTFMDQQWQKETVLMEFSGETGQQTFTININPVIAMLDFYDKVADATTDKYLTINASTNLNLTDVFVKLRVDEMPLSDSGFIRITHRWVPPDPLQTPLEGLTLSDYRHWRIDGILPQGTQLTGSFMYNRFNNLDGNLMANPADSLVILYRPNTNSEWVGVDFTKIGAPNTGYLETPNIQLGDYTLAVWSSQVNVNDNMSKHKNDIMIYPNPAQEKVYFEFKSLIPTQIKIFNANGQIVGNIKNLNASSLMEWDTSNQNKGVFIIQFIDKQNKLMRTDKILVE